MTRLGDQQGGKKDKIFILENWENDTIKIYWKLSIQILCPFFNWVVFLVLSCVSLYILEMNPLSDVSLANMFSHSLDSLFILLIVSSAVQNIFSLIYSHLFIFFLCFPFLRRYIGKNISTRNV